MFEEGDDMVPLSPFPSWLAYKKQTNIEMKVIFKQDIFFYPFQIEYDELNLTKWASY